jgi:predicted kinase
MSRTLTGFIVCAFVLQAPPAEARKERLQFASGAQATIHYTRPATSAAKPAPSRIVVRTVDGKRVSWNLRKDVMTVTSPKKHWWQPAPRKRYRGDDRVLTFVRGPSGSGKSYLARQIQKELGDRAVILAGDDYFMENGRYVWTKAKYDASKPWNRRRAADAMQSGLLPIMDNTHVKPAQMALQAQQALEHGYRFRWRNVHTPWATDAEQLFRRNSHNTPRKAIDAMVQSFKRYQQLDAAEIVKATQQQRQ